jgi:hypothetical protein
MNIHASRVAVEGNVAPAGTIATTLVATSGAANQWPPIRDPITASDAAHAASVIGRKNRTTCMESTVLNFARTAAIQAAGSVTQVPPSSSKRVAASVS